MGTLREDLRFITKWKDIPGTFGLEIEAEVLAPNKYPPNFFREEYNPKKDKVDVFVDAMPQWIVKNDDSLRNYGLEYVLKEPLSYEKTLQALDSFGEATKGIPFIKGSPSTSVHVHVNMTNETPVTMGSFCTLYMLYENLLVEFCGELRRSNLFALPTRVAEKTMNNLVTMFDQYEKGEGRCITWGVDSVKYAALNLACLNTLGSLEIRSFRGTTDVSEIKDWVGIINKMLVFARSGVTPKDILRIYRHDDLELYYTTFGSFGTKLMGELSPLDYSDLVERNLWYAKEIACSVKSWETISEKFEKMKDPKPKKEKKKADTGMEVYNQLLQTQYISLTPVDQPTNSVWDSPTAAQPWNTTAEPLQPYPFAEEEAMLDDFEDEGDFS